LSAPSISRRSASRETQPVQPPLQVVESDPRAAQRRRSIDNLWIAAAMVLLSVFMIGLMRYVLSPAVKTVTNATTHSTGAGGP
jgi:hypothetical protein